MALKMLDILEFNGTLKVLGSGLRIGGEAESAPIGGTDNPIIRHPITGRPYVPGSSVKGKIRSLLESKHCPDTQQTGEPCSCGTCTVCQLFGCGSTGGLQSPTRLVFRDCQPTEQTRRTWEEAGTDAELKTEVMIDRNKGVAHRFGPRKMERIPAGSDFEFSVSLRYFEGDDLESYYRMLAEGFELLGRHYLGGSGSRGYGEVAVVAEDGTPMAEHLRRQAEEVAS